jgi:hypothetical protein
LIARSRKARTIHQIPTTRNRKPSTSARPANVSAGLTKQITAEIANSRLNAPDTQRVPVGTTAAALSGNVAIARVWALASANIKPTRTPTVVIEASLNCRITRETTTQAIPAMSQAHQ